MKPIRNPLRGIGRWFSGLFQGNGTRSSGTPQHHVPLSITPPTAEELMQSAMSEAMALTETTEDPMEKWIFQVLAIVCYALPFFLAWLVGSWLGDGFSTIMKAAPDQKQTYTQLSVLIEMTVPIASISCARGVKRARVDPTAMWMMIAALIWFLAISVGSAVAQWVLYTSPFEGTVIPQGVTVVALFRGGAPVLGDLICATFLSLHGYKSLKRKIAQLDERSDAVTKIFQKQAVIVDQADRQKREREDAEEERMRRNARGAMLDRVQELQTSAMLDMMEQALLAPGHAGANGSSRQQRGF